MMMSQSWGSAKAADPRRDPRILVHSAITSRDRREGEFKIRGRAIPEQDADVQTRYAEAVTAELGWHPEPGRFHLFAVEIRQVTFIRYDDATGGQHVATSLDDREPVTDILVSR